MSSGVCISVHLLLICIFISLIFQSRIPELKNCDWCLRKGMNKQIFQSFIKAKVNHISVEISVSEIFFSIKLVVCYLLSVYLCLKKASSKISDSIFMNERKICGKLIYFIKFEIFEQLHFQRILINEPMFSSSVSQTVYFMK